MIKQLFWEVLTGATLFLLIPFTGAAQTPDSTLVLDDLIRQVRTQNPELQSSYEGWRASKTRIPQ